MAEIGLVSFMDIYRQVVVDHEGMISAPRLHKLMWAKMLENESGMQKQNVKILYENLKKTKLQFPYMPDVINYTGCCAIKKNGGLYTPCCGKVKDTEFCATCSKKHEFGTVEEREQNIADEKFKVVSYGVWLKKANKTISDVYDALREQGLQLVIPVEELEVREERKNRKGRPAKSDDSASKSKKSQKAEEDGYSSATSTVSSKSTKSAKSKKAPEPESDDEEPKKANKQKAPEPESDDEEPAPKKNPKAKKPEPESDDEEPKKAKKPKAKEPKEPKEKKEKKEKKPEPESDDEEPAPKKKPKIKKPEPESEDEAPKPKAKKSKEPKEPKEKKEKKEKKDKKAKADSDEAPKAKAKKAEPESDEEDMSAALGGLVPEGDLEVEEPEQETETRVINGEEYENIGGTIFKEGTMVGKVNDDGDWEMDSDSEEEFE